MARCMCQMGKQRNKDDEAQSEAEQDSCTTHRYVGGMRHCQVNIFFFLLRKEPYCATFIMIVWVQLLRGVPQLRTRQAPFTFMFPRLVARRRNLTPKSRYCAP